MPSIRSLKQKVGSRVTSPFLLWWVRQFDMNDSFQDSLV
jgi:hypothetical protein